MTFLVFEGQIFDYLPPNPLARAVLLALLALFGWQSKGFIRALREDRRTAAHEEVDLLDMVEKITARKMQSMDDDLEAERVARRALERRVSQLERRNLQLQLFIESKSLEPPEWPSHLKD